MRTYEIQPFFFPTTVAVVDDSAAFLANLSLQLDSRLAFRLFQSPIDAVIALNGGDAIAPEAEQFFSLYRNREDPTYAHDTYAHHVIDVSLDLIHREVHNERRFEQVSVAVVDFDMPEIDGLELCRSIRNPAIRKILLTGKADERVAVRAFNQGLIDRFIVKQDAEVIPTLNRAIGDMQLAYFGQIERMLSDALSIGSHTFLCDPVFAQRFREIREELGIVEHYLACTPDGVLMLDSSGTSYLLIVQTEEMMRASYEIAYDQAAPEALLTELRSGRVVPYFWGTSGNYSPVYKNWRACLHPATECRGKDWYVYAVVKNPAGFNLKYVSSYGEYLDRLDEEGREGIPGPT